MSATLCLIYSDAWPIPSGNMTRVFRPMPATLGGSCRGEPADGMMTERALRNTEPAVSISSDWFSLLHCQWRHRQAWRQRHIQREKMTRRERKQTLPFWVDKEISWHRSKAKLQASESAFPPSLTNWFGRASGVRLIKRRCRPGYAVELALFEKHSMQ